MRRFFCSPHFPSREQVTNRVPLLRRAVTGANSLPVNAPQQVVEDVVCRSEKSRLKLR